MTCKPGTYKAGGMMSSEKCTPHCTGYDAKVDLFTRAMLKTTNDSVRARLKGVHCLFAALFKQRDPARARVCVRRMSHTCMSGIGASRGFARSRVFLFKCVGSLVAKLLFSVPPRTPGLGPWKTFHNSVFVFSSHFLHHSPLSNFLELCSEPSLSPLCLCGPPLLPRAAH